MKLSGHTYNNDVFASLINQIKTQPTPTTQKTESEINIFSSVTQDNFDDIQKEELQVIASELQFAADRAKVDITKEHLASFARETIKDGLRGKKLERAAQKFCNKIAQQTFNPLPNLRKINSPELLDNASTSTVVPAGYNPEHGQNDHATGGYMGMSKNPNTIWDSDSLTRKATVKTPDELLKLNKEAQTESRKNAKQEYWQDKQDALSQENIILEKTASVQNVSTVETIDNSKKVGALPTNSLSMFGSDRDFNNIPKETPGETVKMSAEERANKKDAAREEWNKCVPAIKTDNRSSIDRMFEGLADKFPEK
jgi:hypothetical protein